MLGQPVETGTTAAANARQGDHAGRRSHHRLRPEQPTPEPADRAAVADQGPARPTGHERHVPAAGDPRPPRERVALPAHRASCRHRRLRRGHVHRHPLLRRPRPCRPSGFAWRRSTSVTGSPPPARSTSPAVRGRACGYIRDRLGVATMNSCSPAGPRGAADATSRLRQRQKLAAAINGLGAAIVGLQGIENSAKFGHSPRHRAGRPGGRPQRRCRIARLGLRRIADGARGNRRARWSGQVSSTSRRSCARSAPSVDHARPVRTPSTPPSEPLAQRFARAFALDADAVTLIVNQFTPRTVGSDDASGAGLGNAQRVAQAAAACRLRRPAGGSGEPGVPGRQLQHLRQRGPVRRGSAGSIASRAPTSRRTPRVAGRARWTTCWPTTQRTRSWPVATSGTSIRRSRWPSSTPEAERLRDQPGRCRRRRSRRPTTTPSSWTSTWRSADAEASTPHRQR